MRKTPYVIVTLFMILALLSIPAAASKIFSVPTADVAGDAFELEFLHHRGQSSVGAQFGLLPGLSGGLRQNFGPDRQLYATLRGALVEETQSRPGFALGAELSLKQQHIYAVVSKQLGVPGLRGHFALGTGRYSRAMAGVIYMLNPVKVSNVPTVSVFAEYDGQGLAGGVITQFSPEFKANLAVSSQGASFGLGYKAVF